MQSRAIKSLSESDIQELRRGGGWGLALPAELNGMPGPVHLLELKDQIPLATDQVPQTHLDELGQVPGFEMTPLAHGQAQRIQCELADRAAAQ